ncbi:type III-B CRISPR module-associated protein Cmr3 [Bacillus sp. FJAT-47783]|uniref:type III-B CRISPR module-associated protein Cmr3 n=1 Tax=Bacillus sp. FJAT-47783 TaxID=2922712 RepID=UPI001FADCD31|nr:type III-B CRISPR module-associated protein Cmr3 [Bacillus sp. FJAT-47783]
MKKIEIKPVDTFFFKNHQTTVTGTDTRMTGMFPPRPNTIYGALRAAYIHEHTSFTDFNKGNDEEVRRWMGTPDEIGEFSIDYMGLNLKGDLLFPIPYDYQVVEGEGGEVIAYPLNLQEDLNLSSRPSNWRLFSNRNEKSKGGADYFIKRSTFKDSVLSNKPITEFIKRSDLLAREDKLGIALDYKRRKSENSMLYSMVKWRFKEEGSLVVYTSSEADFANVKFARLGGENRPWYVRQAEESFTLWSSSELDKLKKKLQETRIARIVFLSPTIFAKGSVPSNYDGNFITLPNGVKVELLTSAVGRAELFGGWNIVYNKPKNRKPMVPAGSVFYVRLEESQIDDVLSLANGMNFTDEGAHEGFGFAIISSVNIHK